MPTNSSIVSYYCIGIGEMSLNYLLITLIPALIVLLIKKRLTKKLLGAFLFCVFLWVKLNRVLDLCQTLYHALVNGRAAKMLQDEEKIFQEALAWK